MSGKKVNIEKTLKISHGDFKKQRACYGNNYN